MILIERLVIIICHKQRGVQNLKQAARPDVGIRIMNEYTRLCITICIDVEVVTSTGNTSADIFPIILEIHGENALTM